MNALDRYIGPSDGDNEIVRVDARAAPDDRLDVRSIFAAFQRRIWLFASVATVIFIAAVVFTLNQTPVYTASARIMLDTRQKNLSPTANENAQGTNSWNDRSIDSEVAVIHSRNLAERVARELNLQADPDFNPKLAPDDGPRVVQVIKRMLGQTKPKEVAPVTEISSEPNKAVINATLACLGVERYDLTYVIDIRCTSESPKTAARVANKFAELYTAEQLEGKLNTNHQATSILSEKMEELRMQAEADTTAVQNYRIANNLLSTSGSSLTEQELSAYNQQLTGALTMQAESEAALRIAKDQARNGSDDVGATQGNGLIQGYRNQQAQIRGKLADLEGRYGERHPDVLTARRELEANQAQIDAETKRALSALDQAVQVSRQRVSAIQSRLNGAKGSLQQNNRAMIGLSQLMQKSSTSQTLYDTYMNAYKERAAQEGTERPDSQMLSKAQVPATPSAPNVKLNLALGLLFGLGAGMAAAFIAEMLDSALTTAEDIENRLGRRYLGGIPLLSSIKGLRKWTPINAVVEAPLSAYAEAFRNIRTSMNYALPSNVAVVAVTSALPQEGKTTTSICLARSAALQGLKVVLIDCDTRRRGLNKIVKDARKPVGLVELLTGKASMADALVADDITPAMILPLNKSDIGAENLFGTAAFDDLLDELRQHFDLIVLDTAPVLPIADTRVIATKVDAVLFVARWRKTPEHAVRAAFRLLSSDQVRIAGVALTQIDMRRQSRYGYGDPAYYYQQYKGYYA